jgi:hypothetical protein
MSWNVWGKMDEAPERFCNVIGAINPDVLMVEEWSKDAALLEKVLNARVPGRDGSAWHVVVGPDVAVATRYAIAPAGPSLVQIPWNGESRKVRFASAAAQTPLGPMLIGAMHLKCCGGAGTSEDALRIAEAQAINDSWKQISRADAADIRVLGGDTNLVGTRQPRDVLRAGLDPSGADLEPVDAMVLGDDQFYTWRDWTTGFSPGRLDWLTYSESSVCAERSFVFDPQRLSESMLARSGFNRVDAAPSDHLPVVVDLVRK